MNLGSRMSIAIGIPKNHFPTSGFQYGAKPICSSLHLSKSGMPFSAVGLRTPSTGSVSAVDAAFAVAVCLAMFVFLNPWIGIHIHNAAIRRCVLVPHHE